jgi:hypothetical protein
MREELETLRNETKSINKININAENGEIGLEQNESKITKEELLQIEEQLNQELKHRQRVDKELESQMFLRKEAETAMNLLERDVLEKQDTVITLRRQLEDIKAINLQMYNKLQECETSIKNKTNHISHLEQNISVMANTISQLEAKYDISNVDNS